MAPPETTRQVIDSNKGWTAFARVLTETAPRGFKQTKTTRTAIQRLIRTGR